MLLSPSYVLCSQTCSASSDPAASQAGQALEEARLPKPPEGWGCVPRVCSGTRPPLSARDTGWVPVRAREPRAPPCACRVLWDLRARGISPLGKQAFSPALRAEELQAHLPPSPAGSPARAPASVRAHLGGGTTPPPVRVQSWEFRKLSRPVASVSLSGTDAFTHSCKATSGAQLRRAGKRPLSPSGRGGGQQERCPQRTQAGSLSQRARRGSPSPVSVSCQALPKTPAPLQRRPAGPKGQLTSCSCKRA